MNSAAIMDLINDLEERFDVDRWTVGALDVWPILRVRLAYDLLMAHQTKPASARKPVVALASRLAGVGKFLYAFLADRRKNAWPQGHADVVLVSDGVSFARIGPSWYERFCDPLSAKLAQRGLTSLLISPSHEYRIPRHTASVFIQPALDAVLIAGRVWSSFSRSTFSDTLLREYPEYRDYVRFKRVKIEPSDLGKVGQLAADVCRLSRLYERILKRVTPSIVGVVSYYGVEGMAVNLACRKLGIPSMDLQHGAQGNLHFAYARWHKVPRTGYSLLPSLFWCWSESDAETITKWASGGWHQAVVGGNLLLNEWRESGGHLVSGFDRAMTAAAAERPRSENILVTLQFALSDEEALGPLIAGMRSSPPHWRWWLRLHPCMLKDRAYIKKMVAKNGLSDVEVDRATDLPLYALLRHMDVHVTHSSSTVIEAELFGVPSVIIADYGAEFFSDQISSGWARAAYKSEDIVAAVAGQLQARAELQRTKPAFVQPPFAALDLLETLVRERTSSPRVAIHHVRGDPTQQCQ